MKLSVSWGHLGHHARGPLIVVSFGGAYPPGSAGNEFAEAMIHSLRSALAETDAAGIVLDLTDVEYVWGDAIAGLAIPLSARGVGFRSAAIVATGPTARALQPLLEPNFLLGVAGVELVPTREEAVKRLRRALDRLNG